MRVMIVLGAVVLSGCASPREKDCKKLLPLVDAAHAKPTDESAAALRAFTPTDPALADPKSAFSEAVKREAVAEKALADLGAALKIDQGAAPPLRMEIFEPSRPHAERLVARCMLAKAPAPPDCAALARALEACITPAHDDTTAEEQLLACADGFAAVKSDDASVNESIQALAKTIRDLEPYARNVRAPAKEVIRVAKELAPRINDGKKARADANKAEIELRGLCQREGTRGPS